ncbi:MAG: preprotein translocase subunit YajC [Ilumatobacteraceae bacterium]
MPLNTPLGRSPLSLLANTSSTQDSGGSFLFTLVFMALIGGAMYFLMIRPQRRRLREAQELQRAIEVGDEIITNSGVYGFVNAIDGDVVWLEIADNTEIRIARNSMLRRINPAVEPAGGEPTASNDEGD